MAITHNRLFAFATHIEATWAAAGQSANCCLIDPLIMNYWFSSDMSAEQGINFVATGL